MLENTIWFVIVFLLPAAFILINKIVLRYKDDDSKNKNLINEIQEQQTDDQQNKDIDENAKNNKQEKNKLDTQKQKKKNITTREKTGKIDLINQKKNKEKKLVMPNFFDDNNNFYRKKKKNIKNDLETIDEEKSSDEESKIDDKEDEEEISTSKKDDFKENDFISFPNTKKDDFKENDFISFPKKNFVKKSLKFDEKNDENSMYHLKQYFLKKNKQCNEEELEKNIATMKNDLNFNDEDVEDILRTGVCHKKDAYHTLNSQNYLVKHKVWGDPGKHINEEKFLKDQEEFDERIDKRTTFIITDEKKKRFYNILTPEAKNFYDNLTEDEKKSLMQSFSAFFKGKLYHLKVIEGGLLTIREGNYDKTEHNEVRRLYIDAVNYGKNNNSFFTPNSFSKKNNKYEEINKIAAEKNIKELKKNIYLTDAEEKTLKEKGSVLKFGSTYFLEKDGTIRTDTNNTNVDKNGNIKKMILY